MNFKGRFGFWFSFGSGFSVGFSLDWIRFGSDLVFGFSIGSGFDLVWILDLVLVLVFRVGFGFLLLRIQRCLEYLPSHSLFDKQVESIDFWNNMPVKSSSMWQCQGCNMKQDLFNEYLP